MIYDTINHRKQSKKVFIKAKIRLKYLKFNNTCNKGITDMNNLQKYLWDFFDNLEVFEDVNRGHHYKIFMKQSILDFLDNETKENAFLVYQAFFDSYRITLEGESNPFVDLLDVLKSYEENAATLIDKQRDHFIHSVNVFILGLCIFSQNKNYRAAFNKVNMDKKIYPNSYDTKNEEFFYRWGLASLFHDVGYPVEIIGRQVEKFIDFATNVDDDKIKVKAHLAFENFERINSIPEVLPKRQFTKTYFEKYDSCIYIDLLKPIDLLAHKLHQCFNVDLKQIKEALDQFVFIMADAGFIDHGFYSAIIVLKWYGLLIQKCNYNSDYFFYPVLDSASAILLHNYYKNVIMKPPFSKGTLSPFSHPIAYLLILCDELQEWNREAYGILDKKRAHANEVSIFISNHRLDITYIAKKGILPERFSAEKEALFSKLLDMNSVFDSGFSVGCEALEILAPIAEKVRIKDRITTRPLLDNLERLAIAIHGLYNQRQLERHPNKVLEYPRFEELTDSMKYSNLRQAQSITKKLDTIGYIMLPKDTPGEKITKIPEEIVEYLAREEHDAWVAERIENGWVYGEKKNVENKITPYLVDYDLLSEEIKELDRDTVRNIPVLADMLKMAIYKKLP